MRRFRALQHGVDDPEIVWRSEDLQPPHELLGDIALGSRRQPFSVFLRPVDGHNAVRCVSPVGRIDIEDLTAANETAYSVPGTKITVVPDDREQAYNVAVEGTVLLNAPLHDASRVSRLIRAVAGEADRLEEEYLEVDASVDRFDEELMGEVHEER
jgi:hypothetical protein